MVILAVDFGLIFRSVLLVWLMGTAHTSYKVKKFGLLKAS